MTSRKYRCVSPRNKVGKSPTVTVIAGDAYHAVNQAGVGGASGGRVMSRTRQTLILYWLKVAGHILGDYAAGVPLHSEVD